MQKSKEMHPLAYHHWWWFPAPCITFLPFGSEGNECICCSLAALFPHPLPVTLWHKERFALPLLSVSVLLFLPTWLLGSWQDSDPRKPTLSIQQKFFRKCRTFLAFPAEVLEDTYKYLQGVFMGCIKLCPWLSCSRILNPSRIKRYTYIINDSL